MHVLVATADPVRLSFLVALLRDAGCTPLVLDEATSAITGGLAPFPRRLAVPDDDAARARAVLREAGELDEAGR
jgi:hypothetical protein